MNQRIFFYISFAFLIALFAVALTQPEQLRIKKSRSVLASLSQQTDGQSTQNSVSFNEW